MSLFTIISTPRHIADEACYRAANGFDPQPGTRRRRRKTLLMQQPGQESRKRKTVISFLQAGNQRKRGNQTMTFVAEGTREQSG